MRTPIAFLRFVAKAVGNAFGAGIAGDFLVDVLPQAVKDVWGWWSQDRNEEERRSEIEALAQAGSEEIREQIAAAVQEVVADQPPEVRQAITTYLAHIPASIRRSLRRPSDPGGTTVPLDLVPKKPDDLLRLLPSKLPRYKPGDFPLPGVDWQLVQLLGVGGFGEVWKARNPYLSSVPPVALKFCVDARAAKVLRNEAAVLDRVMTKGKHPGIVQLQHSYLSAETPCLEYEYVEGSELTSLILESHRSTQEFKPDQATEIIFQLAMIVGAAHRSNPPMVHRDLKPANILLQNSSTNKFLLRVADFGIGGAAISQAVRDTAQGETRSKFLVSAVQGAYTPLYASPQQMRGGHPDPRDDVFAIGVIWYQMLTGDLTSGRPGGSRWRTKLADRGVPSELTDLLESCFEDNPDDRPADSAALADQLRNILSQKALACFHQGAAHLANSQWDQAIAAFSEVLRIKPATADAYNKRGQAFGKKGEYTKAIADFTEAIHLDPQNAEAFRNRGIAHSKNHNWLNAIDDFNQAVRLDPQNADAYCNLGIVYFEMKDIESAIANLNMAIRFNSHYAEAYFYLGLACEYNKRFVKAIHYYTEAIRFNPNYAEAYWKRAIRYRKHKNHGRAISDYSAYIRLKPQHTQAYWDRGDLFRKLGEYDRANADIKEAIRLDPAMPLKLEIQIPGKLSVRPRQAMGLKPWKSQEAAQAVAQSTDTFVQKPDGSWAVTSTQEPSMLLAESPGIIEISPITLAESYKKRQSWRKSRLEKLRAMNLPEVILHNELMMIELADAWIKADHRLEDYAYTFKANDALFKFDSSKTEESLVHLSALTQLDELDLRGCSVTEKGLSQLRHLSHLRELRISRCPQLIDKWLVHLSPLARLEKLELSGCSVTGKGLGHLSALRQLSGLNLSGSALTSMGLVHVRDFPNLRKLSLDRCGEVTDEGLVHLSDMAQLSALSLVNCSLTDIGLIHLSALTQLLELNVTGCWITNNGLAHLHDLANLRVLLVSKRSDYYDGYHLNPQHSAPSNCGEITDEGLVHLSALTHLEELQLLGCPVTGKGLAHLSSLTQLKRLDLGHTSVCDNGLFHLSALTQLEELYLSECSITDRGLAHLSPLSQLETLYLDRCPVTGKGLAMLRLLSNLHELSLYGCGEISDAGFVHLAALTQLRYLNLAGCNKITPAGVAALKSALPECEID